MRRILLPCLTLLIRFRLELRTLLVLILPLIRLGLYRLWCCRFSFPIGFCLFFNFLRWTLCLLGLLIFLLALLLRLHNVIHKIVNVLIINLFFWVIVLGWLLLPLCLALVIHEFLLLSMAFHIHTKMLHCTILCKAFALTHYWVLHGSLVVIELLAVMEDFAAIFGIGVLCIVLVLGLTHLLLVLLLLPL